MTTEDYAKGDFVLINPDATAMSLTNGFQDRTGRTRTWAQFLADGADGEAFRVTRVGRGWVDVRLPGMGRPYSDSDGTTVRLRVEHVRRPGADWVPPRKLGERPEGDHIAIDDPRIAWIWEDLASYADGQNWCRSYDTLAERIGIPGRVRNFTVSTELAGGSLTVAGTFQARSKHEALTMLADQLNAATN